VFTRGCSSSSWAAPGTWFLETFPRTFRKHVRAFFLSLIITLAGFAFGGLAVILDPDAKEVLLPFPHLQGSPSERVAQEEKTADDELKDTRSASSRQHWGSLSALAR
jgi:hypothetical protein